MAKPSEESPHYIAEGANGEHLDELMGLVYEEDYAAALGRLLVKFNNLEERVGWVLGAVLQRLGKYHLYDSGHYYIQKVDRLELALCAKPDWPLPDFNRLRKINRWRNDLAHGHFHKDPLSGQFLTRDLRGKRPKAARITPPEIHNMADAVDEATIDVGRLLRFVWLDALNFPISKAGDTWGETSA